MRESTWRTQRTDSRWKRLIQGRRAQRLDDVHLIVDFGGVISLPQRSDALSDLAQLAGLHRSDIEERYWAHRDDYDRGLPAHLYWATVLGRPSVPAALVRELNAVDVGSWTHLNFGTIRTLTSLRGRGASLTLLSNSPHAQARDVARFATMRALFPRMIFSCELGIAKPDADMYLEAARQVPTCSRHFMIDDRTENLHAAERLGITPILFTDAMSLGHRTAELAHV